MFFAGFDKAQCPPLEMMARLLRETNLIWCGYYLKAPSQSGAGWTGKRAALVAQGWGLAPIFVGQQTKESGPGSHLVNGTQGKIDGARACDAMKAEGFPSGSWVYLDLENGPPFLSAQKDYVGAWIDNVEAGGFRSGVYCSYLFAKEVAALRPLCRIWAFKVPTTAKHPVGGTVFPTPDPIAAVTVATTWQRDTAVTLSAFGELLVDLDVSVYRDPGAPDLVAGGQVKVTPPVTSPAPSAPLPPAPLPDAVGPALPRPATSWWSLLWSWLRHG